MTIYRNDAEGQIGGTVATGGSGGTTDAGGDFLDIAKQTTNSQITHDAISQHGQMSYLVVSSASAGGDFCRLTKNTADDTTAMMSFGFRLTAKSGSTTVIARINLATGGSISLRLNGATRFVVVNAADAVIFTSTNPLSINTWYRLELRAIIGGTITTGTIQAAYYLGDDTSPVQTFSSATANSGVGTTYSEMWFGDTDGVGGLEARFDSLQMFTGATDANALVKPWPAAPADQVGAVFPFQVEFEAVLGSTPSLFTLTPGRISVPVSMYQPQILPVPGKVYAIHGPTTATVSSAAADHYAQTTDGMMVRLDPNQQDKETFSQAWWSKTFANSLNEILLTERFVQLVRQASRLEDPSNSIFFPLNFAGGAVTDTAKLTQIGTHQNRRWWIGTDYHKATSGSIDLNTNKHLVNYVDNRNFHITEFKDGEVDKYNNTRVADALGGGFSAQSGAGNATAYVPNQTTYPSTIYTPFAIAPSATAGHLAYVGAHLVKTPGGGGIIDRQVEDTHILEITNTGTIGSVAAFDVGSAGKFYITDLIQGTSQFILGTTKPNADNTGLTGPTTVTSTGATLTLSTSGQVIENTRFERFVSIGANTTDVTFRNCSFMGPPSFANVDRGLVNCFSSGIQNIRFERCHFEPTQVSPALDGIFGYGFTAHRCFFAGVEDGIGIHNPANTQSNVVVEGCYIDNLAYHSPNFSTSDNKSHNDCIQLHPLGHKGVTITSNTLVCRFNPAISNYSAPVFDGSGNLLSGYLYYPNGQWGFSAVQFGSSTNIIENVNIEKNWIDNGQYGINCGLATTSSNFQVTNNRWGRSFRNVAGTANDDTNWGIKQAGLTVVTTNNAYEDNGTINNTWKNG